MILMSFIVNEKEFAAVSKLGAPDRYSYFIRKVADWKEVWSIGDDGGWRVYGDDQGNELVPVWPAEAYANACCTGDWQGCKAKSIPLDVWMSRWISGMTGDGRMVSVFALPIGLGIRVDPERLASDISEELQNLIDI
jgi:Protein of unknown function (DUF2750)